MDGMKKPRLDPTEMSTKWVLACSLMPFHMSVNSAIRLRIHASPSVAKRAFSATFRAHAKACMPLEGRADTRLRYSIQQPESETGRETAEREGEGGRERREEREREERQMHGRRQLTENDSFSALV